MNKILAVAVGLIVVLAAIKLFSPSITGAASSEHQQQYIVIKAPIESSVKEGEWLSMGASGGVVPYSGTFAGRRIVGYANKDRTLDKKRDEVGVVVASVEQLRAAPGDYRVGQMLTLAPDPNGTRAWLVPGEGIREIAMVAETTNVPPGGKLLVYVNLPTTRIQ
jgi:hypothetical protein